MPLTFTGCAHYKDVRTRAPIQLLRLTINVVMFHCSLAVPTIMIAYYVRQQKSLYNEVKINQTLNVSENDGKS